MRLLTQNCRGELSLAKDLLDNIPPYAILSHTWGPDEEEVTFEDLKFGIGKNKPGYAKLQFCEKQARTDKLAYFWVDTCCIDKANHVELSEAITSMFRWYRDAVTCYVYLSDVSARKRSNDGQTWWTWESAFRKSKWFTRGWTLQELLAPKSVEFFARDGEYLGSKKILEEMIQEITDIPITALQGTPLSTFPVDERLQWATKRNTRRVEDKAYCLLGLFEIYMPLIYGEGDNAWHRLKEEIDRCSGERNSNDERLMEKLAYVSDAPFNSYTNQRHASCLENTRVAVLQEIERWAINASPQCVFWLMGMAGTGKSTVAFSMAMRLRQLCPCLATFFFRRGFGDLAHARKLIPTIVHQLALSSPAYRRLVLAAIKVDPNLGLSVNLKDQYEKLIAEPLRALQLSATRPDHFMVIIDALDECEDEKDLRLLLRLLATTPDLSHLRLRVLVTSRPDWVIKQGFQDMPTILYQDLVLHDVPRQVVDRDIEVFLRHQLGLVQRDRQLPPLWPQDSHISTLVNKAAGLFIFAATACRYIAGSPLSDPRERLEQVCSLIAQNQLMTEELDQMYTIVLRNFTKGRYTKDEQERIASRFRLVVGSIVMLLTPLSVSDLYRLLVDAQLSCQRQLEDTLRPLHAVIDVPKDTRCSVQPLHLSFRDFLLSQDRCLDPPFQIDEQQTHRKLAWACIGLLSASLHRNIGNLPSSTTLATEVLQIDNDSALSPAVQYACRYWTAHLQKGKVELLDHDQVHKFLRVHFLHWLEAMSLIDQISEAIIAIINLAARVDSQSSPGLHDFVHDCHRFLLAFRHVISHAPGQLYQSCLFFSPLKSTVRKTFSDMIPKDIVLKPPVQEKWSPSLQTLEGHSGLVRTVVFSPDSRLVASGSNDSTVRLWDVQTGVCRAVLEGHSAYVDMVAFSPDGSLVASGSNDSSVRLWDVQTGESRFVLSDHLNPVKTVAFSPDGQLVASSSRDGTVRVWDVQTGNCRAAPQGHSEWAGAVVFSPDSQLVALESDDGTVRLWNVQMDVCHTVLDQQCGGRRNVLFLPDDQIATVGSRDSTTRLWDLRRGDYDDITNNGIDYARTVSFAPDRQVMAFCVSDGTIRLSDVQTGGSRAIFRGQSGWIKTVVFSPDGQLVASGSDDGTIWLWNVQSGDSHAILKGHSTCVLDVVFSPNGRIVASGSADCTIRLWHVQTVEPNAVLENHSGMIRNVVFSNDVQFVESGTDDGNVGVWAVSSSSSHDLLNSHSSCVNTVAFSPDGQLIASGSDDDTIRLWDVQTGVCRAVLNSDSGQINVVIFSPDGRLIASGSDYSTVEIWDVQTQKICIVLNCHSGRVLDVVFSSDSLLVAAGLANGIVELWDVQTGDNHTVLNGSSNYATAVVFSLDCQLVASGQEDGIVRLWEVQTGDCRSVLDGHVDQVEIVVFSSDSELVASGSVSGTVLIWDAREAQQKQTIQLHSAPTHLEFNLILDLLFIDGKAFSITSGSLATASAAQMHAPASTSRIFIIGEWVMRSSLPLLWLPPEYRLCPHTSYGNTVAFGFVDGRVSFLSCKSLPG